MGERGKREELLLPVLSQKGQEGGRSEDREDDQKFDFFSFLFRSRGGDIDMSKATKTSPFLTQRGPQKT